MAEVGTQWCSAWSNYVWSTENIQKSASSPYKTYLSLELKFILKVLTIEIDIKIVVLFNEKTSQVFVCK